jgi:hypothetical protein
LRIARNGAVKAKTARPPRLGRRGLGDHRVVAVAPLLLLSDRGPG